VVNSFFLASRADSTPLRVCSPHNVALENSYGEDAPIKATQNTS